MQWKSGNGKVSVVLLGVNEREARLTIAVPEEIDYKNDVYQKSMAMVKAVFGPTVWLRDSVTSLAPPQGTSVVDFSRGWFGSSAVMYFSGVPIKDGLEQRIITPLNDLMELAR